MVARYDYIVAGAGAAGCVVAARLSEDPTVRVLLLEAGPPDSNPFIAIPGAAAFTLAAPELNWHCMTEPQSELNDRSLYLAQGKVVGGGSSINGLVYTRGSTADYAGWSDYGARGWTYDDVLPWFRRASRPASQPTDLLSGDGKLEITHGGSPLEAVDAFLDGAEEIGLPRSANLNAPDGEGLGHYDWMIGSGRRSSSSSAYLKPARKRPNLDVITGALATHIVFERLCGRGVQYRTSDGQSTAWAEREVILSGGAINSPALLMRSGIGPAEHLSELGIAPLLDQKHVGANLRNHLSYQFSFRTGRPVSAYRYLHPMHGAAEVLKYAVARKGFFASAAAAAGGFYRSGGNATSADMQAFMVPIILGGLGTGLKAMMPNEHGLSFFVNQGRPYSHGHVRLRSADPAAPPSIDPHYLSDSRDVEITIDGISRIMGIAQTRAFARIEAHQVCGPESSTRTEIERSIRANGGQHYHVCGTCRMGEGPANSVVDSRLRLHGVSGVRVVDASIMPNLLNANLAAPVMMIAERAAAFIREDAR